MGCKNIDDDLDLVSLIKTVRHMKIALDCSLMGTNFRTEHVKHTHHNVIAIDSEEVSDEQIEVEGEDEMDMNIIQAVIPKSKLFITEKPEVIIKKAVDYKRVKRWMKRQDDVKKAKLKHTAFYLLLDFVEE